MERHVLTEKMAAMKSRVELLDLLNVLKQEEVGVQARPFTPAQLSYFCNPRNSKRFKTFTIPKKSGGTREISAPVAVLRSMLHYINIILTSMYNPKRCVMGFTEGKSIVDNARMHIRQNYVLNIDLADFFPSIAQARVWKRLQVKPYNLSQDVASTIAGLCSIKCRNEDGSTRYVLPQGAPTSPILSNIICERLDYKLTKLAKHFGVNYSRYADDMTFSSMHNVYQADGEFITSLKRIISEENFKINEKKTRLQKRGARQEVTGLNVTSHANVTRKYVIWIRTMLHIWERYGYQEAYSKFYPQYKAQSGGTHKGEPNLANVLSGKLLYMKMVKGEFDSTYTKLNERFKALVGATDLTKTLDLKYSLIYTIYEFENKYSTAINVKETIKGTSLGFNIADKWQDVFLSKNVDRELFRIFLNSLHTRHKGQDVKGNYYISLCVGNDTIANKTNTFWLVTNKKPKMVSNEN